ncbi:MAG TPA: sigma factor-like helix-turn-helix DNA-binding protein [Flavisolibacter sp.]|nr:sigma factor-like helix-turn-helix DNA-binding protein [Flavisolibacter sp.]
MSKEEGMSNREIAERLDVSIKTVEAQMTIALKRLRTRVGFRLVCLLIVYSFLS